MIDLRHGDCLEILKTIPDNSIDLIVTDPPYEINATGRGGSINDIKKMNISLKEINDVKIDKGYKFEEINRELIRIMKNINIYIWCNKKQIPDYFNLYINELGCKFDILCWHKTNALPAYKNKYLSDTEYCLYFRKNGYCDPSQTKEEERYENAKSFYLSPLNHKDKQKYSHPTIKPLEFIEKLIKNSSKEGEMVLDCFMGSGTTGVACKKLGRNFIGIEIEKEYFDIAKNRINNYQEEITLFDL